MYVKVDPREEEVLMLSLALLPIAHPIPHAPEHLGVSGAISDGLGDVRFTPESEQLLHCREVTLRANSGILHRRRIGGPFDHPARRLLNRDRNVGRSIYPSSPMDSGIMSLVSAGSCVQKSAVHQYGDAFG